MKVSRNAKLAFKNTQTLLCRKRITEIQCAALYIKFSIEGSCITSEKNNDLIAIIENSILGHPFELVP